MASGSVQKHPDAIGYIDDLMNEVNQPWFKMLCDFTVISGGSVMDQEMLNAAVAMFQGDITNIPKMQPVSVPQPSSMTVAPTDFLEQLSDFSNFKLLCDTLRVDFLKQITLVFGANGSGKSSLCESLKLLSSQSPPNRPIENVRASSQKNPTFSFKFKSEANVQKWTQSSGYGLHSDKIKYFDSAIAFQNISMAVEPGRVIVSTPFRLQSFENIKALTTQVRDALREKLDNYRVEIEKSVGELREQCGNFPNMPLASIDSKSIKQLAAEIAKTERFRQHDELTGKLASLQQLEKATSNEGLASLKIERKELETFTGNLRTLTTASQNLWALEPVKNINDLENKKEKQKILADAILPDGGTLESLMSLIRSASEMCELDKTEGGVCPLCRRKMEDAQVRLFGQYYELLTGQLESEIIVINKSINEANKIVETLRTVNLAEWDELSSLSPEVLVKAKTAANVVIANCSLESEPLEDAKKAVLTLENLCRDASELLRTKVQALNTGSNNRAELLRQIEKLQAEIQPLAYYDFLHPKLPELRKIQQTIDMSTNLDTALKTFRPLLTRITNAAKIAYEELVVSDFETRLNSEYQYLTEKEMSTFGVVLKKVGAEGAVTVLPQVGASNISGVLSEGELRVHALALFFAELECNCPSILIFDDPASSFDYNFIANYCIRLRDFILAHPNCQVIILTHNWEFFVQLQAILNKANLNNKFSVQVLENCAAVLEYSEKVDELVRDITAILANPNEPSKQQKEEMAGKMRRLIEAVVNTHVFNSQRHQYKQKSQSVSEFNHYTKVTPLLPSEATALSDLYSKLSITEHDDPRTAYVNTDKATFQTRYNQIESIKAAIIARK